MRPLAGNRIKRESCSTQRSQNLAKKFKKSVGKQALKVTKTIGAAYVEHLEDELQWRERI